jgi:diguanylate cyclase (GGDEF)-like protein
MEHIHKIAELEKKVKIDHLTQIGNRVGFMEELESRMALAKELSEDLVLGYIDLDDFKEINDNFGHQAGDKVLIEFANYLKESIRKVDYCARLGGDEFAVILSCSFSEAVKLEERMLEHKKKVVFNNNLLNYDFSFGFTSLDHKYHVLETFISQADATMYGRKKVRKEKKKALAYNRYLMETEIALKEQMSFPLPYSFVMDNTIDNIKDSEIRYSTLHGFGLFATNSLKKGTVICELTGQIMTKLTYQKLVHNLTPLIKDMQFYFLMECNHINDPECLMVRSFRTKWSYVNHCINPNCYFDISKSQLITIKDIQENEEITFDYRTEPLSNEYKEKHNDWLEGGRCHN